MMDVTKHAQDIINDIAATEKKVLRVSTDRVKKAVGVTPKDLYTEGVDATRDIVNYGVKSQKKLGDTILNRLSKIQGVPAQAKTVSTKVQTLAQEVLEAQQDLVNNVADVLAKLDPMKAPSMVKSALQHPADSLKSASDMVMDMDLIKKVTGKTPKQQAQAAKKTVRKTATKTKTRAKKATAKRRAPAKKAASA